MKLLLTSEGLSTPEIISAFEKLCVKKIADISVAFINEGHLVEKGDKRWPIEEMGRVVNLVGGTVDLINLFALTPDQLEKRLQNVDAIYVLGGHTDYLMHVFNKTGFTKILPNLLSSKVYVGTSAGSMILGRRISTLAYEEIYGEEGDYGTTEYMNVVDFAIKPHLNSPEFPKVLRENLLKVSEAHEGKIFVLKDNQAIVVDDDEISTVGGKILTIRSGQVV